MRKSILISLLVGVLALGTMGASFANVLPIPDIGSLARGEEPVPNIEVDEVGFHLDSSEGTEVRVDGLYLSFTADIDNAAISMELRDQYNQGLCYFAQAKNYSQDEKAVHLFKLTTGTPPLPRVEQVYKVCVFVGENSVLNADVPGWTQS